MDFSCETGPESVKEATASTVGRPKRHLPGLYVCRGRGQSPPARRAGERKPLWGHRLRFARPWPAGSPVAGAQGEGHGRSLACALGSCAWAERVPWKGTVPFLLAQKSGQSPKTGTVGPALARLRHVKRLSVAALRLVDVKDALDPNRVFDGGRGGGLHLGCGGGGRRCRGRDRPRGGSSQPVRRGGKGFLFHTEFRQGAPALDTQNFRVLAQLRERIVRFAASHFAGDAAEDLAQEVLLLLHEKYPHLATVEDLLPLSLQIVRFKIMSLRRKAVRRGEYSQVSITDIPLPDLEPGPADLLERKQMLERLTRAIPQLAERCRELIRLKLQGKSFPEIQKIMGVAAINTVYTWDHRCRKNLLELMGGDWEPKDR